MRSKKHRKKRKKKLDPLSFRRENEMIKEARYRSIPGYACVAYFK